MHRRHLALQAFETALQLVHGLTERTAKGALLLGGRETVVHERGGFDSRGQLLHLSACRRRYRLHIAERLRQRNVLLVGGGYLVALHLGGVRHLVQRLSSTLEAGIIFLGIDLESGDYVCHINLFVVGLFCRISVAGEEALG